MSNVRAIRRMTYFYSLMILTRIYFCFTFFVISTTVYGQYRLKHYNVNDGLSQNTINDVLQDKNGFLWLATQEGLNRFDGYHFRQLQDLKENSSSIQDQFIWGLKEDHLGNIWCCSREGISRIEAGTLKVVNIENDIDDNGGQRLMIEVVEGEIWVTTSEGVLVLNCSQKFEKLHYKLSEVTQTRKLLCVEKPLSIHFDTSNKLVYILSQKGLFIVDNDEIRKLSFENELAIYRHMGDQILVRKNLIYIATNEGLFLYRSNENKLAVLKTELFKRVFSIITVGEEIWVSTENGIFELNTENGKHKQLTWMKPFEANVLSMYTDLDGSVWLNTSNDGCYTYSPSKDQFKFLDTPKQYGVIWAIKQFGNELWLASEGGVLRYSLKQNYIDFKHLSDATIFNGELNIEGHPLSNSTCFFEDERKRRYIGTKSQGVYVLDSNQQFIKQIKPDYHIDLSNNITSVVQFDSSIWISSYYGIFRYDMDLEQCDTLSTYSTSPLPTNYIFKGTICNDETLWFGTNKGILIFKDKALFTHIPYRKTDPDHSPSFYFVNDVVQQEDQVWISTFGGGVNLLTPATGKFQHFENTKGLKNLNCSAIQLDKNANLWIGHNKGISKLNGLDHSIINYSVNDGLLFNEIAMNSSFNSEEGYLFFGTPEGIIAFDPLKIDLHKNIKPPVVTKFMVNYSPAEYSDTITLSPKDVVVSFEFSALDYKHSEELKYAYRIKGIDSKWAVVNSSNRMATYSTLPYGEHILEIKTIGANGEFSLPLEILIVVTPPFWYTWWFISLVILTLLIIIFLSSYFYHKKKLEKQLLKIEVEQKIHLEKERISSDLHDNVGAQITHIIQSLDHEVYRMKKEQNPNTKKLNEINDFARYTMDELRNTIWVINNESISVNKFKNKVLDYLSLRLHESNLEWKVEFDGNEELGLNADITINLFRVIQEALTNTVKHSGASNFIISFRTSNNTIEITIIDNGNGMIKFNKEGHFGLKNMKHRAKLIGAEMKIYSEENQGTTINLKIEL